MEGGGAEKKQADGRAAHRANSLLIDLLSFSVNQTHVDLPPATLPADTSAAQRRTASRQRSSVCVIT